MTPAKNNITGKATGIKFTAKRMEKVVDITVDFGELGQGVFSVRPLLYTDSFIRKIAEKMTEEGENSDGMHMLLLPLIADWDIMAPAEQIHAVLEDDGVDLGEGVYDEDSEQTLYKLPVCAKAMRLFPTLGKTSGTSAILGAMAEIPFATTKSSKTT